MSMEMKQKSGANSQLVQAQTINNYYGITEERAREIIQEEAGKIDSYTQEALSTARERIGKLEDSFMEASSRIDGALESFADPAFQILLRDAAERAAATEREEDYDLLSQLLICHIQKGKERKNRAGIHRAIRIVDEIDNDALCALTVFHAAEQIFPAVGSCLQGFEIQEKMFSKLMYMGLPEGEGWMDHLDVLGAIRINPFGKLKKLEEYNAEILNGYVCVGIKKDSKEYDTATSLLCRYVRAENCIVDNELLDGYVRLDIPNERAIDKLEITFPSDATQPVIHIPAGHEVIDAIKKIWNMYSKDESLLAKVKQEYNARFNNYEHLRSLTAWWNAIPHSLELTSVGKVLAHTNAKRCDPIIPDML